jgi:N-acetylmuramoyl-L-alanine amidase
MKEKQTFNQLRSKLARIGLISCAFMLCFMSIASAKGLMLEYDGAVHEYSGEIYKLVVDNREIQSAMPPIVFNDRALVPVREVCEAVGATVSYEPNTQTIDISRADIAIKMNINQNTAYVNGKAERIPDNVVPKLIAKQGGESKTMIPVRYIGETIGAKVDFDENAKTIILNSQGLQVPEDRTGITQIKYGAVDENVLQIIVSGSKPFTTFSQFTLTDPNRFVVDIDRSFLETDSDITVNESRVSKIRLGQQDTKTRLVVDAEAIKEYYVGLSDDKTQMIIFVTTQPASQATPPPGPSATGKVVVIDAGHGGKDPGADGVYNGNAVYEKDLTLSIAKKVAAILQQNGVQVVMTRTGDTYPELSERSDLANTKNAAVFVSVHINSVEGAPTASGTEVYYSTQNNGDSYGATSEQLAQNILDSMIPKMGTRNRGVKTANHLVTRTSNMPAALVEVGFITNEEEVGKMLDEGFQQKVAEGIAEGIMKTLPNITK